MKFGKRLRIQMEDTLPQWRNKFLSYKQLKKRLKRLQAPECFTEVACELSSQFFPSPPAGSLEPVKKDGVDLNGASYKPHAPPKVKAVAETTVPRPASVIVTAASPIPEAIGLSFKGAGEGMGGGFLPLAETPGAVCAQHGHGVGQKKQCGDAHGGPNVRKHGAGYTMSKEETNFIKLLNRELEKFNNFFIEKEEDFVIRLQMLKERINAVSSGTGGKLVFKGMQVSQEVLSIRQEVVAFHGEMILLENYSALNYMGLVKIIKKHDKVMGTVLRLPFIHQVLRQPFFTTELLSKLVKECEDKLRIVFPHPEEGQVSTAVSDGNAARAATCGHDQARSQEEQEQDGVAAAAVAVALEGEVKKEDVAKKLQAEGDTSSGTDEEELALPRGQDVDSIYRSTLAALRTLQDMQGNLEAAVLASTGKDSSMSALTAPASCEGQEQRDGQDGDIDADGDRAAEGNRDEERRGVNTASASEGSDEGRGECG
eukprot:jgi/Mesen1/3523/ME000197S02549